MRDGLDAYLNNQLGPGVREFVAGGSVNVCRSYRGALTKLLRRYMIDKSEGPSPPTMWWLNGCDYSDISCVGS